MTKTAPPWWGSLLSWSAGNAFDQASVAYDGEPHAVGIAEVPSYYSPVGAHPTSRLWCLADPATGIPGAVLSDRRYTARMCAEAALTEAVALGRHVSDTVDRIDGVPPLLVVLGTAPTRPTPIAPWLMAAAEAHRGRIHVYYRSETTGTADEVAEVTPVWDTDPVPAWHLRYTRAPRPEPVVTSSWAAAAADIITATDRDHGGPQ